MKQRNFVIAKKKLEIRESISNTSTRYNTVCHRPVIKGNGKLLKINLRKTSNDPDPTGMHIWVTTTGKEQRHAEMLAEIKGID